jgi:ubiquinone/menaquinone biosynthesis C-methylase UbiE
VRYPRIRFETASMHALPLADGALGGIVSWYSVIHAAPGDLPSYLEEFRRVLAPGAPLLAAFFEGCSQGKAKTRHGLILRGIPLRFRVRTSSC